MYKSNSAFVVVLYDSLFFKQSSHQKSRVYFPSFLFRDNLNGMISINRNWWK